MSKDLRDACSYLAAIIRSASVEQRQNLAETFSKLHPISITEGDALMGVIEDELMDELQQLKVERS